MDSITVTEPLLLHGDCLELLLTLEAESVDLVLTDPPAGISFMGKNWDSFATYEPRTTRGREVHAMLGGGDLLARAAAFLGGIALSSRLDGLVGADGVSTADRADGLAEELRLAAQARALPAWARGFVVFMVDVWSEVDRVLKPGGFVCAWALPKTADLAGMAMRFTGWTLHENLTHAFGSGMNKAGDIGKKIDAEEGAERAVVGTSPTCTGPSQATGMLTSGVSGAPVNITAPATEAAKRWTGWHSQIAPGHEQWLIARKPSTLTYAQQLVQRGCGAFNVDACRIPRGEADRERATAAVTQGSGLGRGDVYGDAHPEHTKYSMAASGSHPRNLVLTAGGEGCPVEGLDRQSGVTASTSRARNNTSAAHNATPCMGKSGGDWTTGGHDDSGGASRYFTRFDQRVGYFPKASDRSIPGRSDIRNEHPTHKHPDLMRWLVRLMAATAEHTGGEPAVVLDPFMGSGTTGVACVPEVRFIGIERDPVDVLRISQRGEAGCAASPWPSCSSAGSVAVKTRHKKHPKRTAPHVLPSRGIADPWGDRPMSFYAAEARIMGAIGSPELAAEANDAAPVGAQLGLL